MFICVAWLIILASQVSTVKNEGVGPTKATVPINVPAAVLIYGNMCSVCKDPVIQVRFLFHFKLQPKKGS